MYRLFFQPLPIIEDYGSSLPTRPVGKGWAGSHHWVSPGWLEVGFVSVFVFNSNIWAFLLSCSRSFYVPWMLLFPFPTVKRFVGSSEKSQRTHRTHLIRAICLISTMYKQLFVPGAFCLMHPQSPRTPFLVRFIMRKVFNQGFSNKD